MAATPQIWRLASRICLGARFDDRVTGKLSEFGKNAKIIHVDIDPSSISKIINADYPIVGDVKSVLEEMLPRIKSEVSPANFEQWRELIRKYDEIHPLKFNDSDEILKPLRSVARFINTAVNFKIERR